MPEKTRYALVGTGGRCTMFLNAICDQFAEHAELVGLCDLSETRMRFHADRLDQEFGVGEIPCYPAQKFTEMLVEQRADRVIVTTMDATHHQYIVAGMEAGCDVISEKPMTTDEAKATEIRDAIERTGRDLRVTFNYRYTPLASEVRKQVADGAVGQVTSVDFAWVLNTSHGADYFRRWHREKDKSGGLLVHKATHHFDLVNFWIADLPQEVFAYGDLKFYGKENAAARGEHYDYDRYTGEAGAQDDPFALDLSENERTKALYLDAEADSGYVRDRNVFGENITIEDTMAVLARYRGGPILNYSLYAYCPWEGFRVAINGTRGRLEILEKHGAHIITGDDDDAIAKQQQAEHEQSLRLFPMFGTYRDIEVPRAEGSHGGGDKVLLEQIFDPDAPADPLGRDAGFLDGAASILLGVAGNRSIATGQPVKIDELLDLRKLEEES